MRRTQVLIIGGGPAGAACAWRLRQRQVDCLVLDQHSFPRPKVCAGWITPEVVQDLALDPASYPHSFTTFRSFLISIRGLTFRLRTRQHAIRRVEFDDWLVRRSGAELIRHTVKEITAGPGGYTVDGEYAAKYLVGAGGTHCPVRRALFEPTQPRRRASLIVAMEEEFAYPFQDAGCRLWFLQDGLPGYAWYVPKAGGYVNAGVGGGSLALSERGDSLRRHWDLLVKKLDSLGLVRGHEYKPVGHSYYLRQPPRPPRIGNAFLVGDSAGLSTRDMGEGIGAAVRSGLLAADSITSGLEYNIGAIPTFSAWSLLKHGWDR